MFDILFGWRKASKCKNLVRLVQCRLKLLKIKRHSIVRQSRDDIAQLLNNGRCDTAFSRVEQLFKDQNLLAAYDLLDHYCEFIIIHFPYIRKHKDCPNDINEAVSTLIYAAAWCGDLPELKMIQKLFGKRYGLKFAKAAIGLYPGNLIREKLCIKSVPDNAKVRLIDEVAKEYCDNKLIKLNLPKLCGNDGCQWEGFVFNEKAEVDHESLSGAQIPASCYISAAKIDVCNVVGSFYQPEMKLSEFSMEDSFQFHNGTVKFEEVQEFRFSEIQDECEEDKRTFLFFDSSSIFTLGDCSTFGGASFLFLSNYDYGGHEIDRPGLRNETGCLRKSHMKSNGKRSKGIDSKESQLYQSRVSPVFMVICVECREHYEEFFNLSQNEKPICHQCSLPSSKCRFNHRKSCCRCGFSEDINLDCSLEHPCYHNVMEFHNESLIKESTEFGGDEVTYFSASCTSSGFQHSERSNTSSHGHVHPNLPDYDEVAAKFMALKKEHRRRTGAGIQGSNVKDSAIQHHVNLM